MIVISHRGCWRDAREKNQRIAFQRTVAEGFGTETDVRDLCGRLVIAHDPPFGGEMELGELLALFAGSGLPLAVNVKADGLSGALSEAMRGADCPWFAFDMSVPEMVRYECAGLPYYTRHSDVELEPVLYPGARGVWLDAFAEQWFTSSTIESHLAAGKHVCIVSSELHGRDPQGLWRMLRRFRGEGRVMLCTDEPNRAKEAVEQ